MGSDKQLQQNEGLGDRGNIGWRAVTRSSRLAQRNGDSMPTCAYTLTSGCYKGLVLLLRWSYDTGLTMTTLNTAQGVLASFEDPSRPSSTCKHDLSVE
jgi:hypothetical protein